MEKPINGTRGWTILFSSIIASLMGSGSGVYVYMHQLGEREIQRIARPDPATGTELNRLHQELRSHLLNHPDIINQFDRRITRIETLLEVIIDNQKQVMENGNGR